MGVSGKAQTADFSTSFKELTHCCLSGTSSLSRSYVPDVNLNLVCQVTKMTTKLLAKCKKKKINALGSFITIIDTTKEMWPLLGII